MKIIDILAMIDTDNMALPEFQRGYVWNRDQVRGLMHSLYRKHPIGSLLVWTTNSLSAKTRGESQTYKGTIDLLLDGQQRITSLYGIIRGKPPKFFDGNPDVFTNLYFNVEEEGFEFYAPVKMADSPLWINVTHLMQRGVGEFIGRLFANTDLHPKIDSYISRLTAVGAIKEIDLHIEKVIGEDKTIDVVVDIFNRVNSGGTKLSKGDLALAKVCAEWPEARNEMKQRLKYWSDRGLWFDLDWLLRNITTTLTGQAMFTILGEVDAPTFHKGLNQAEKAINYLLNLVSGRLGLDHDRVLGGRYAFPVMSRYVALRGGQLTNRRQQDELLYWYIHTFLWGRFTGSTETVLNQDLRLVDSSNDALDNLISQLRSSRGDLRIRTDDFAGMSLGSRFYPLLYLLTRVYSARDWCNGLPLSANILGKHSSLQVHHIFPKALLYKAGYGRNEVNAIANYCFLTGGCNLSISDNKPQVYLAEIERRFPGAIASQWIPMDRNLWKIENYKQFLAARRELLARAANELLDSFLSGQVSYEPVAPPITERPATSIPGRVADEEEERLLYELNNWILAQGLPKGELRYELLHPESQESMAFLDLAWPNGLQQGLSQPVALLVDESQETEEAANRAGYRFFTDISEFRNYVQTEILALELRV